VIGRITFIISIIIKLVLADLRKQILVPVELAELLLLLPQELVAAAAQAHILRRK